MKKNLFILSIVTLFLFVGSTQAEDADNFAYDFLRLSLADRRDENVVFSPASLKTVLRILRRGAKGETEAEIAALLKNDFAPVDSGNTLSATSLWLQKDAKFLPDFLDEIKTTYQGESRNVDFAQDADEAVSAINSWVHEKTGGKIATLYDQLDESTRLVATSVLVFEDRWKTAFDKDQTAGGEFTLPSGKKIRAEFMSRAGMFQHREGNDVSILELPYETEGYSMLILLPSNDLTLAGLEAMISTEKVAEWVGTMENKEVDLRLPKLATESETECNGTLEKLGVQRAFSRDADFSRMTGRQDLYLGEVKQKVFFRMDESGTEAAQAAVAVLKPKSILRTVKSFHADRPFLFLIRKQDASGILFLGRVVRPTGLSAAPDPTLSGEGGSFN